MQALLVTSLTKTTVHKMAALTVVLSLVLIVECEQTGPKIELKTGVFLVFFFSIALDCACDAPSFRVPFHHHFAAVTV